MVNGWPDLFVRLAGFILVLAVLITLSLRDDE